MSTRSSEGLTYLPYERPRTVSDDFLAFWSSLGFASMRLGEFTHCYSVLWAAKFDDDDDEERTRDIPCVQDVSRLLLPADEKTNKGLA